MRIPDGLLKSVIFIGIKIGDQFQAKATGFIVLRKHVEGTFFYVVSARHVVTGLANEFRQVVIRVNKKGGGSHDFNYPIESWWFHPNELEPNDVAVTFFGGGGDVDMRELDFKAIDSGEFSIATRDRLEKSGIGPGDQVSVLGLFRSHYGSDHNIPIARMGNIASIHREPVKTANGYMDAYLIEAHSISGLSGSPVILTFSHVREIPSHVDVRDIIASRYQLLGLMHGHFDVGNMNGDVIADATGRINTGIGIVIPVDKIIEAIEHPLIGPIRQEIIQMRKT